jgi:hypothetical protein
MTNPIRILLIAGAVFGVTWVVSTLKDNDSPAPKAAIEDQVPPKDTPPAQTPASATGPASKDTRAIVLTDSEKQVVTEFEARVKDYAALHQKLERTLSPLPDKATPEQIDEHQEHMAALIKKARKGAKQGDFFTPGMQALVKRALGATLDGAGGKTTKQSTMDDNPGLPNVGVNDRYPEGAPVSSMPIELLETLPKLGDQLEYRFLGKRLVLVDACAEFVLDITPNVMP